MLVDRFYADFEAAFRGGRAEILQRLAVYLDFVVPLAQISPSRKALDLGCGRGEWLELLGQTGYAAHGVDLDAGMLQDCFALGLSAEQGDAIAYLKTQPDSSVAIVSGFHIAEHLPFAVLQELVAEALRVLEPAGLLILETPNPENIRVGSMTFHMDPTHNKPLPPGLLSFLARHYGFARVQVLRLQEAPALRNAPVASLAQVFTGVSPDYAVVAQKQSYRMSLLDAAFATDRGLTLETLSERFEAGMVRQSEFERSRADLEALRDHVADLENDMAARVSAVQADMTQRLDAIQASTSWRVTAPLRAVGRVMQAAKAGMLVARIKERVRPLLLRGALAVHKRPKLRRALLATVRAVPGLEARLRSTMALQQRTQVNLQRHHGAAHLTGRGQAIYDKLIQMQDS